MQWKLPIMRVLIALLVFIALPGVQEGALDLVHFIRDGHTAHDPGHEDEERGHCCSGHFHVCPCHPHATATPVAPSGMSLAPSERRLTAIPYQGGIYGPGYSLPPFRPPAPLG
jgi:hypothetical protein